MNLIKTNSSIQAVVQRMAIAVLRKAYDDAVVSKVEFDKKEAVNWFKENSREPFGFAWCKEYSGINPNVINEKLKEFGVI